jgi:hypothetical protein
MWRSILPGVVLAGVLAGCSLGGGTSQSYPKLTLVVRVFKMTAYNHQKVVRVWRLGCSPPNGPRSAVNGVWMNPKPGVACEALRDYVKLRSPNRDCSCVHPPVGSRSATVEGVLDGHRVNATLPEASCRCSLSGRQVHDLQAVTGLK